MHVNGSRGKSSVARLIAAGLRGGGLRVVAKTTGSAAAFVHVDGSETPVRPARRSQHPRAAGRDARRRCAKAATPWSSSAWRCAPTCSGSANSPSCSATHGVITNVRPDHLEVMGPTLDDVAASLAGTVPRGTRLYTAEAAYADYLASVARQRGSTFTSLRCRKT